jgi:hypothetical protein
MARRDLDGASMHYNESLAIARSLLDVDRNNGAWARDVIASVGRLGDVAVARDDEGAAHAHYRESLEMARALLGADPANAESARHVWVALWKLAETGGAQWAEVVVAMEDAQRRGLFNETRDGMALAHARVRAQGEVQ